MFTLPELGEAELESPKVSASGPAEYRVVFGTPCKAVVNVRIDSVVVRWPRIGVKGLAVVARCEDFWPHLDVKASATGSDKVLNVLIDDVSEHRDEDSELLPLPRDFTWEFAAHLAGAALCAVVRTMLNVEPECRFYARIGR